MSEVSPFDDITLKDIPTILPMLSVSEQEKLLTELEHLNKLKQQKKAQTRFIDFVKQMREECIAEMYESPTDKIQQLSGRILSYDQILTMSTWGKHSPSE